MLNLTLRRIIFSFVFVALDYFKRLRESRLKKKGGERERESRIESTRTFGFDSRLNLSFLPIKLKLLIFLKKKKKPE